MKAVSVQSPPVEPAGHAEWVGRIEHPCRKSNREHEHYSIEAESFPIGVRGIEIAATAHGWHGQKQKDAQKEWPIGSAILHNSIRALYLECVGHHRKEVELYIVQVTYV